MQKRFYFHLLFWSVSLLHIGAKITATTPLGVASKALIVPLLALYLFSQKNGSKGYGVALFFSWLGDLLLIPEGTSYFGLGIASFWVTQGCFIALMIKQLPQPIIRYFSNPKALVLLLILGGYLVTMLSLLLPQLDTLKIPIVGYATTLAMTGFLGLLFLLKKKEPLNIMLALGCMLFLISDSMIALDHFYFERPIFTYWIMITYIPAQYFIGKKLIFN